MTLESNNISIGMMLFRDFTQLDLTGPYEIFARIPDSQIHLISNDLKPIRSQHGMVFTPDTTYDSCPKLDILFVPGGPGIDPKLADDTLLTFLNTQGKNAQYVTSVCTGALLLGAASLLQGYRATTHWLSLDMLTLFGAILVDERVVVDRNRITGGGVTAGIDFALTIAGILCGEEFGRSTELYVEYDPQPPFGCGSPRVADSEFVAKSRDASHATIERRRKLVEEAASKVKLANAS
jgi:cyclohexyl-isocyanide hydratase